MRKPLSLGFLLGLAAGLATALAFLCARPLPRASAQGVRVESPSFQIAAWSLPGLLSGDGRTRLDPTYGAYLLDVQRGNIYLIKGEGKPTFIGDTSR